MKLAEIASIALLAATACTRTPEAPKPPPTVRFLERVTGGAGADERLPMIVVLHPMGGDPADMRELFRCPQRARLVFPYGHPFGGKYLWYAFPRDEVASVLARETDRLAADISALAAARPTLGKPAVTGFSQGGTMAFALAVTHPEVMAGAFPIGGRLPPLLAASAKPRAATLPPISAFHGADDLAVPTEDARASIATVKAMGYAAQLHTYPGVAHDLTAQELADVCSDIERLSSPR